MHKAFYLCVSDAVRPHQQMVPNFFHYLQQANYYLSPPTLEQLMRDHVEIIALMLDAAMQRLSFMQLGMEVTMTPTALKLLEAYVVAREGNIPAGAQVMTLAFLSNGCLELTHAPQGDQIRLWE
jgi:hypothetical protein